MDKLKFEGLAPQGKINYMVCFFNLDMKLVAKMYSYLGKRFDNMEKDTSL
ncbi:hypothetical protein [Clostridium algidicarnis]|nr:hypothetical protein [Clostridium algidicarnis]